MSGAKRLVEIQNLRAHGFSQQEIADQLGITRQVVTYHLKKLKQQLL